MKNIHFDGIGKPTLFYVMHVIHSAHDRMMTLALHLPLYLVNDDMPSVTSQYIIATKLDMIAVGSFGHGSDDGLWAHISFTKFKFFVYLHSLSVATSFNDLVRKRRCGKTARKHRLSENAVVKSRKVLKNFTIMTEIDISSIKMSPSTRKEHSTCSICSIEDQT